MFKYLLYQDVKKCMPKIDSKVMVKNKFHEDTAVFLECADMYYFCIGEDTKQSWLPTHWKYK